LHPLPAHLRSLSDSSYLAWAAGVFVLAAAIQVGMYLRLLRPSLQSQRVEIIRAGMIRWIKLDLPIQAGILVLSGVYIAVQTANHVRGAGLVAPPVAAVLGSALPLQVVVAALMRSLRP
jgi:hypothetical protein